VGLIESPLPQAFQVQGDRNQEIDRGPIPAFKKCLPDKSAQGLGQGRVPSVLEPMNGLHESAVVDAKGPCLSEMPWFDEAFPADMVVSFPRNKRAAAF
jgi:hypothetical protein